MLLSGSMIWWHILSLKLSRLCQDCVDRHALSAGRQANVWLCCSTAVCLIVHGQSLQNVNCVPAACFLQILGRCIASANSPLDTVRKGVQHWLDLGVPAHKLVLGLPWYGT